MPGILGGGGGDLSGGSNFTSQGGLLGGAGSGGVIGPISDTGAASNLLGNLPGQQGGGGGLPSAGGPTVFEGGAGAPVFGGGPGGIGSSGALFEPNQTGQFNLAPPGSFDPQGQQSGGFLGLPGIGQTLGNTFSIDQSQTRTGIAPEQSPGLQAAITAAAQLAGQQLDPASAFQNFIGGAGADLFGIGQDFLGGIGQAQQGLLGAEDPSIVQGRIDALGTDIRTQLGEFIGGAGGLQTQGALAGNLGGVRGHVREGIAARGATDAFAREAAGIRESAAGRRLEGLLGGAQAGQIGAGAAGDVFNLGLAPSIAQFGPLAALSGIIGDPKVLTETLSQGNLQRRGRDQVSEAFQTAANRGQVGAQESLNNPSVLLEAGTQLLRNPRTAQQGQLMIDQANKLTNAQNEEFSRMVTEERALRGELESTFAFDELAQTGVQFRIARALFEEGTPTATTQLARVLEKTIDPTGVVRPSDFELILSGIGASDRVMDAFRRFHEGGQIPPSLAPDIMRTIALVAQQRRAQFTERTAGRFRDMALANRVRPSQVFFDPLEGLGIEELLASTAKAPEPVPDESDFNFRDFFGGAPPTGVR